LENPETERQLLEDICKGDSDAFWELWSLYSSYARRVCFHAGGSEDDVSDVMMKLFEKLPVHAPKITNLKAWIGRLAKNVCIDNFRKRAGGREVLGLDEIESDERQETAERYSASHPTDSEKVNLAPILEKMSRRLKETFVMHFVNCLTYREIAEKAHSTEASIRKRIQRARAVVRKEIESMGLAPLHVPGGATNEFAFHTPLNVDENQAQGKREVVYSPAYLRVAPVTLGPGLVIDLPLVLSEKPYGMSLKIQAARNYVRKHPRGLNRRIRLARLLRDTGKWSEAMEECSSILQKAPGRLEVLLLLGDMLRSAQRQAEAADAYRRAVQAARRPATRCYLTGLAAACERDYTLARYEFERASEMEPSQDAFRFGLLQLQAETARPIEALQSAKKMLADNPKNAGAGTIAFQAAAAAQRPKEAERLAAECLSRDGGNLLALKCLADLRCTGRLVSGDEGKATLGHIRSMMRLAPNMPAVRETLARFQFARGQWKEATEALQVETEAFPDQPLAWLYRARWLFRSGDYEEALAAVMKAYRCRPHDPDIAVEAAGIGTWSGDAESRAALAQEMTQRFPQRFDVLLAAARLLAAEKTNLPGAYLFSREATYLQPELPETWLRHGEILLVGKHDQEALKAFDECRERLAEDDNDEIAVCAGVRATEALAETLGMAGKFLASRISLWSLQRRIGEFLRLDPPRAYYWEGRLCAVLGHASAAAKRFEKSLSLHIEFPERSDLLDRLSRLRQLRSGRDIHSCRKN
jgi:RNA polymerase sigma factor (sigma-70 family)